MGAMTTALPGNRLSLDPRKEPFKSSINQVAHLLRFKWALSAGFQCSPGQRLYGSGDVAVDRGSWLPEVPRRVCTALVHSGYLCNSKYSLAMASFGQCQKLGFLSLHCPCITRA